MFLPALGRQPGARSGYYRQDRKARGKQRPGSLRLEWLEDRVVPATLSINDIAAPEPGHSAFVSGTLSPGLETVSYGLAGTAGQRLSFINRSASSSNAQWNLYGPANQLIAGANLTATFQAFLPSSGPYALVLQGNNNSAITYNFEVDDATETLVSASGFGTVHSGTISAGGVDTYAYTASAGQVVYFDSLQNNAAPLTATLKDPLNNTVFSTATSTDSGPVILQHSGTFTLTIQGNTGTSTGTYNFNLLALPANATTLAFNTPVNGTLSTGTKVHLYSFTATAGQKILFDGQDATSSDSVAIYSGGLQSILTTNTSSDSTPLTLTEGGTYYLVVSSNQAASSSYQFQILNASAATSITLGTPFGGTLSPGLAAQVYSLAGTAGQSLFFQSISASGSGSWSLYDAANSLLTSAGLGTNFETVLHSTGTHTLVLTGSSTGGPITYNLKVLQPTAAVDAYTLGTSVSASLAGLGDTHAYTFSGTAGQRIVYDGLENDFDAITATLLSPSGATVTTFNSDSDQAPITLLQTGTYRLLIDGMGATTGTYNFRLLDAGASPSITLEATTGGTLNPGLKADVYTLSGTAGQHLFFQSLTPGTGTWTLYGPNNTSLSTAGLSSNFEMTLPLTGTYALVIAGNDPVNPVSYSFKVHQESIPSTAYTLGTVVSGSLANPGDQQIYTFTGSVGQRLYYDGLENDLDAINASLISPTGVSLMTVNSDSDQGPTTLTEAGTYQIVIDGTNATTGTYSFRMLDAGAASTVSLGFPVAGSLSTGFGTTLFLISGTSLVKKVTAHSITASPPNGTWAIYGTDNHSINSAAINTDFSAFLPDAGTYVLALSNTSSSTVNFSFQINNASDGSVSASGFNVIHSGTITAGSMDTYPYMAPQAQIVYYDSLNNNGDPLTATLTDPTTATVFSNSTSSDSGVLFLARGGTYTLTVKGNTATSTGTYSFNLLAYPANAVAYTLGNVASGALNPGYTVNTFSFTGSAGQRLFLDGLDTSGGATVTLYGPNLQTITSSSTVNDSASPVVLTDNGTYLAVVTANQSATVNYSFRIANAGTASAITLGATINGTLNPGVRTDLYTLAGTAGQHIFFQNLSASSSSGMWVLFGPTNAMITSANIASNFEATLPSSGTYVLAIEGANTSSNTSYSFSARQETIGSASSTLGTTVTGSLAAPGDQQIYTFTGSAGQRLIYDGQENDLDAINATILSPSGASVLTINSDSDSTPIALPESGTYQLIIDGSSATTGTYAFNLFDAGAAPALTLGSTTSGSLTPGLAATAYTLSGTAGQPIFFQSMTGSSAGNWNLYDPTNGLVTGAILNSSFETTLPSTGTFILELTGNSGSPISYSFLARQESIPSTAYVLGSMVSGSLNGVGDQHVYTFTGSAGQHLLFDGLENDFDAISAALYSPSGAALISTNSDTDNGPVTLAESGTYRLVIDGTGTTTGTYAFQVLDVAAQSLPALTADTATFTVILSAAVGSTVTVDYATADGSASAPSDYLATSGTLTFTPGQTTQTFTVPIVNDTVYEVAETFVANLSNASGATIADSQGLCTITDDDPAPVLSIGNVSLSEGNSGTTSFTFTVTLTGATEATATVNFATADGTATLANNDYQSNSGTLTFNPGDTSKTITVLVNGDQNFETDETFGVVLSGAVNATISSATGTGTIQNDDAVPAISIADFSHTEGNSGTTNFMFNVSLSATSFQTITVNFSTADGTATTANNDYQSASGTVTFNPGDLSKTVTILVNGDNAIEPNETFFVNLSNASNATIADNQAVGTIVNDDSSVPSINIADVSMNEGNAGTTSFLFAVTLSAASNQTVMVQFATADGTATVANNDYVATSGTLTFTPGQTSKNVSVSVIGDLLNEPTENFVVNLTNATNATIADNQAVGTIVNDDPIPVINVNDVRVTEGNVKTKNLTFKLTLSAASGQTITVQYATADGTATVANHDYLATSGTLTFTPGVTTKTVAVKLVGDTDMEPDETFTLNLSNPTNATLARSQATGTIRNDENALSINDATVTEGNSGTVIANFTVTLAPAAPFPVSVHYATANGTGTAGKDYVANSGDLTFNPGETTKTIPITVFGETFHETDETFFINLTNSINAIVTRTKGTGTILNDDPIPSLSIDNVSLAEGNVGATTYTFTVRLSAPSGEPVSVNYTTADGSATVANNDYLATSGVLTFNPGTVSQTITVQANGDTANEPDENFFVNLSGAVNATLAQAQGTGTLLNDDVQPILTITGMSTTEGDSGTKNLTFTVRLSAASTQTVTVDFATADGTATAGSDYVAKTGTLTFAPGVTSKTFTVTLDGDTTIEPDETVLANLSNATNARLVSTQAAGTILNDDLDISINNVSVAEGGVGTAVPANFTLTLSAAATFPVSVNFTTANGTAKAGLDYVAESGTITFAPGEVTKTLTIYVLGDTLTEPDETFLVKLLSSSNARLSVTQATGTILANPGPSVANFVVTSSASTVTSSATVAGTGTKMSALATANSATRAAAISDVLHRPAPPAAETLDDIIQTLALHHLLAK